MLVAEMETPRERQVRLARQQVTGELLGRIFSILDVALGQAVRASTMLRHAYRRIRREAILHPAGGEFIHFPSR
jgi:hypothetical protein